MTKLEICAIEDSNPDQVYLYPEGAFYKAYQKSAWILCTKVHPFKVSSRLFRRETNLISTAFPCMACPTALKGTIDIRWEKISVKPYFS